MTIQEKIAQVTTQIQVEQAEKDQIIAFVRSQFPNVVNKNLLSSNRFLGQFPDKQARFFLLNTSIQRLNFKLGGFARSVKRAEELEQQRSGQITTAEEPDRTVFNVDFEQLRIKRERDIKNRTLAASEIRKIRVIR